MIYLRQKTAKNLSGGFTLVELLVAISILSLAILAAFTAISNNIRGSNFAEDQMMVYYLADEGIEYVRNWRDQNSLKNIQALSTGGMPVLWLTGLAQVPSDPCYGNNGKVCYIDSFLNTPSNPPQSCSGSASTCPYLFNNINTSDSAFGLYGYTTSPSVSWKQTQFQRSISINVISPTEATVSVTVSWVTNGVSKNYAISETLEAWQ